MNPSNKAVRACGTWKQLFIDDREIARKSGVSLVMNPPYQDHVPVFQPETPWENLRIHPYATILKEAGRYRLWYLANEWAPPPGMKLPDSGRAEDALILWTHSLARLCYAESDDGVNWRRPNLGLVEYRGRRDNNILGPAQHDSRVEMLPGWYGGTVFIDPVAPPEARYKLWSEVRIGHDHKSWREVSGLWGLSSPDGLRWTPCEGNPVPGHADTLNVCFWDDRIEKYVGYSRLWTQDDRGDGYRAVRRLESPDFVHWEETGVAMRADETDYSLPVKRGRENFQIMDFHGNCAFKYPDASDIYFALPEVWWHWGGNPFPEGGKREERMGGFPDKVDVQLMTSRDGIRWDRAGGKLPFLRLGPPGSQDHKMIYAFTRPVPVGDELWIYYGGYPLGISEGVARKRGAYFRARLRMDGFISADAGYTGGELVTKPLTFEGDRLVLNVDTSAGGSTRVEFTQPDGEPIKGFTLGDADEINDNAIKAPATWNGRADLPAIKGKPVCLRFAMRSCKLYSFQFEELEGKESR